MADAGSLCSFAHGAMAAAIGMAVLLCRRFLPRLSGRTDGHAVDDMIAAHRSGYFLRTGNAPEIMGRSIGPRRRSSPSRNRKAAKVTLSLIAQTIAQLDAMAARLHWTG